MLYAPPKVHRPQDFLPHSSSGALNIAHRLSAATAPAPRLDNTHTTSVQPGSLRSNTDFARTSLNRNTPLLVTTMAPSAVPNGTTPNGTGLTPQTGGGSLSANDNIQRFAAPSRPMSPRPEHTLFHPKTRCFI
jgi:hypothetical protein